MSIPTITDPALSATNDASVVETNDRNISASVQLLENSTNVNAYKGLRVFGGTGYVARDSVFDGNWPNVFEGRIQNFFMSWTMSPNNTYGYLDISAFAISGRPNAILQDGVVFGNAEATEPDEVTVKLQRSATQAGTYSDVGSEITLSYDNLDTYTTVDLSGVAIDASKPWHRVQVVASSTANDGSESWRPFPVYVCVNVRMKADSV